jgi:hypothetical protein
LSRAPLLVLASLSGLSLAGCREREVPQPRPVAVEPAPRDPREPRDPDEVGPDAARPSLDGPAGGQPGADGGGAADRAGESGGGPASALVLHLGLDEAPVADRTKDSSGEGNDGLLVGPPERIALAEGKKGRALALDGGVYLRVPSSVSLNGVFRAFTAAAFVQLSGTPAGRSAVLARQGAYALGLAGGRPYLSVTVEGSATAIEVAANAVVAAGRWVHVAGVFDPAGVARVYLDGREVAALPVKGTIGNSMVPLTVGARLAGTAAGEPFTGALDEVRLYTRALGAAEIGQLATGL